MEMQKCPFGRKKQASEKKKVKESKMLMMVSFPLNKKKKPEQAVLLPVSLLEQRSACSGRRSVTSQYFTMFRILVFDDWTL